MTKPTIADLIEEAEARQERINAEYRRRIEEAQAPLIRRVNEWALASGWRS